jgi:hypothetical protein
MEEGKKRKQVKKNHDPRCQMHGEGEKKIRIKNEDAT